MTSESKLCPHGKGTDICATEDNVCIIRSDLGCYMKSEVKHGGSLDHQQKLQICPLNPSCAGGDHYLCEGSTFYIIRGDSFVSVTHLTQPIDQIIVKQLADICKSGDHYLSFGGKFCVVFTERKEYLIVSSLNTGADAQHGTIDKENLDGLYYYGSPKNYPPITIVHQVNEWGVMFAVTRDLSEPGKNYFIYPDVINFLSGGLSFTFGPSEAKWELVKSVTNNSVTPLQWSEKISKTVGYKKSHFQSVETNWKTTENISMGTKFQAGFIVQVSLETQFSLSKSFGGVNIRSEQEDWNEAYTTEETLSAAIPAGATIYIWQFRLGLKGTVDVLFCHDLQITETSDPPNDIPLPKAISN